MLWICNGCTSPRAVGVPKCPECGRSRYTEEGANVPRINTQGVTDARLEDPDVELRQPRQAEDGEDVSPGNSSSASGESRTNATEKSGKSGRKPARTTARP